MKTLACFIVFASLLAGMSNCGSNYTVNSDGSSPDISAIMNNYLDSDPIRDWRDTTDKSLTPANILFQDADALVVPEEIEAHKAEMHIRAFKNKFHRLIDSTWVIGYVSSKTKRNHEQLPGPTIEATNGTPTQITWVNQLKETLQKNETFNFPRKGLKYYPLVYNTKTLEASNADPSNPNLSASIPMMVQAIYPAHFDPAQDTTTHQHGGPLMFNSTYYSTTVHLHGANLAWKNDGYTASSIVNYTGDAPQPAIYGLFGPYEQNKKKVTSRYTNTFEEANFDTKDTTLGRHGAILWYHDHSIMRTTPNVYMGLFGAYIIEGLGESESKTDYFRRDRSRKMTKKDVDPTPDIPLLISDKMFTKSGTLYYESKFDGGGRQPEFYGNTITVNGKAWPHFNVTKQTYRFRILNTSSSRFYRLALARWKDGEVDLTPIDRKTVMLIGTEGGPLTDTTDRYITQDKPLLMAPGERADVLINFSEFGTASADRLVLVNLADSSPYQSTAQDVPMDSVKASKKMYENFVMQFRIQPQVSPNSMTNTDVVKRLDEWHKDPRYLKLTYKLNGFNKQNQAGNVNFFPKKTHLNKFSGAATVESLPEVITNELKKLSDIKEYRVFSLSLTEAASYDELSAPVKAFYGADTAMLAFPMAFLNASEWNMEANTHTDTSSSLNLKKVEDRKTEVWKITNYTGDMHPIHIHLNRFRILGRIDSSGVYRSDTRESGWKDVVKVQPDKATTYLVITYTLSKDEKADIAQFVYHCHILEHEDVSMMRRLLVGRKGSSSLAQISQRQKPRALYDRSGIPVCYSFIQPGGQTSGKLSNSIYRTVRN